MLWVHVTGPHKLSPFWELCPLLLMVGNGDRWSTVTGMNIGTWRSPEGWMMFRLLVLLVLPVWFSCQASSPGSSLLSGFSPSAQILT